MAAGTATSMAVRAFQMSVSAIQEPENDFWSFLEHIEAPQWVDLTLEAALEGAVGDDPWFYQHHPHHETPLEDLVFGPMNWDPSRRHSKAWAQDQSEEWLKEQSKEMDREGKQEQEPEAKQEKSTEEGSERSIQPDVEPEVFKGSPGEQIECKPPGEPEVFKGSPVEQIECKPPGGPEKSEGTQACWRTRAKRIPLQSTTECSIVPAKKLIENDTAARPSDSFSAKLLATLMARLRTSEEMPASRLKEENEGRLLGLSKKSSLNSQPIDDPKARRSPLKQAVRPSLPLKNAKRAEPSKANKENSQCLRKEKTASTPTGTPSSQTKKPRLVNSRKSMPVLDFDKGSFSVGCGDKVPSTKPPRRSSPSRDLLLKLRDRRKSLTSRDRRKSMVRISSSVLPGIRKAKPSKEKTEPSNAELAPKRPVPKYEPRLHSTRDIREWERRSGQSYYSLQPLDRVRVNRELSDYKNSRCK